MLITLDDLRRYAVARSLFPPTTLKRTLAQWGFVQADPIRAPARAQDLMLRHRADGFELPVDVSLSTFGTEVIAVALLILAVAYRR